MVGRGQHSLPPAHVVAGAAIRHVDSAGGIGHRRQAATGARALRRRADTAGRLERRPAVARQRQEDAAPRVVERAGMPEDVDVAAVVGGHGRACLEGARLAGRQLALGLEAGSARAAPRVGESRRVGLQPDDVEPPVGPERELRAVYRAHAGHRERPAVDALRLGPARRAGLARHVEEVAAARVPGNVHDVQPAPAVDDGPRQAAALGNPQRLDRRARRLDRGALREAHSGKGRQQEDGDRHTAASKQRDPHGPTLPPIGRPRKAAGRRGPHGDARISAPPRLASPLRMPASRAGRGRQVGNPLAQDISSGPSRAGPPPAGPTPPSAPRRARPRGRRPSARPCPCPSRAGRAAATRRGRRSPSRSG